MQEQLSMLSSSINHLPLLTVWRDSGVTQAHGFDLVVDCSNANIPGRTNFDTDSRAPMLLDGSYEFLSGLHHEPYFYRARGDKRFVYLAQGQNHWDDRIIALPHIKTAKDLEGRKLIITARAPCVWGNLLYALKFAGVDVDKIEFVDVPAKGERRCPVAMEMLARGEADAANVDVPYDYQGIKLGYNVVDVPNIPVIHNVTITANQDWVDKNEDSVHAYLRSMIDAIHFFKTEKDKVCEILEREFAPVIDVHKHDEVEHIQKVWAELLSPKPFPHPLSIYNVYKLDVGNDPGANFVDPLETWNTSYLRHIEDSGYIDELYGSAEAAKNPPVNALI